MKALKIAAMAFVIVISIGIILIIGFRKDGPPSKSNQEKLKSLPYLKWHPVEKEEIKKAGVIKHVKNLCFEGLNVFNYDGFHVAFLMDMSGKILHRWHYGKNVWQHVEVCDNGDLLGIVQDAMLVRLDVNSQLKWKSELRYHHDIAVAENGNIYSIIRDIKYIPYKSEKIPILDDLIVVLSKEGRVKKSISIHDLCGEEISTSHKRDIYLFLNEEKAKGNKIRIEPDSIFDVFHTNTVEIISSDIEGLAKKGDILICIRQLNMIACINPEKEEIVWRMRSDDFDLPHQPSLIDDGDILLFDNGSHRFYSRVIEIDPLTTEIMWEYKANPKESFFTEIRGGAQYLSNGNILITESNKAHVFEITPNGKIVWEYHGTEKSGGRKRPIYRMTRIEWSFFD